MAKSWKEKFDPAKHRDFMSTSHVGGFLPGDGLGGLDNSHPLMQMHWVYFVREGDFTFQFHSLAQMRECLNYFEADTHPSTMLPSITLEHYWQRWFERLPAGLRSGRRKVRIIKALRDALTRLSDDK